MNRRDALRMLAAGAALQLPPAKMFAVMREARAVLRAQAGAAPKTLNPHQDATVKAMAEAILPRTDTPGASDVGAGEFIDLMLTEWFEEAERTHFLNGLADVDARSQLLFAHDFVECSPVQQGEILIALGNQMQAESKPARELGVQKELASAAAGNFYLTFRRLTLTAFYTSEAGATEDLHYQIIPLRFDGCAIAESKEKA